MMERSLGDEFAAIRGLWSAGPSFLLMPAEGCGFERVDGNG